MTTLLLVPVTEPDGNKLDEAYEVAQDLSVDFDSVKIKVPKFFQYDGASIPAPVWQLIGSPFHPRFMTAAVFHDWIYHTHQIGRDDADKLFFKLLIDSQVSKTRATLMREAVENFGGWYWENDSDDREYLDRLKARIQQDGRTPEDYSI